MQDVIYRDPTDPDAPATSPTSIKASAGDGISLLQSLISNVNSKQTPKRALFSNLPFEIGPGFKISVKGYNILQRQKPARSCYVWLNGEQAQIATGETTHLAEDTARDVQKAEFKKAYKFGGEQVLFTKEEQKQLKDFGSPVLRVIGFKPQSMLPTWASVNKSTFIYPSEEDYVGSTRVFAALWQKLLNDEKMGLAWYIPRVNANPQIVAIIPSRERLDDAKQQVTPAGLWLHPLPFADDIRSPPECPAPHVSPDALTDRMHTVIHQLQLPGGVFDPHRFPNPSLQWHYRILKAMALDEEIPEFKDSDDKTLPKFRQIDKRAGPYVIDWGVYLEEVYNEWVKSQDHNLGTKRGGSETAAPAKPAKRTRPLDEMGEDEMMGLAKTGRVATATVAMLKEWLAGKGLNTSGKKADLVGRVEEFFENK